MPLITEICTSARRSPNLFRVIPVIRAGERSGRQLGVCVHAVTCRLYTPLHYRIGGGRVRRQHYTWSTLAAGFLYQAAGNRAYHGVIAIGHW